MLKKTKVKLESLGIYLPEKIVTMEELLKACRSRPGLDLERITGISQRRVAEGEFAVDLAVKAAQRALAMSKYGPGDLDAIICTSISKHHAQDEFSFEPATAVLVRKAVGAKKALVFDVVNACAGMLNGIYVLQGLIRSGRGALRHGGERRAEPAAWPGPRPARCATASTASWRR